MSKSDVFSSGGHTVQKEFASTQTEKINTEDQVKTARSRPNLLVQIYSYYQDTVGGVTFDTRIQENRRPQDGGHRTGGRMLWIRIPRSRKGQPDYLWIPRWSGHI